MFNKILSKFPFKFDLATNWLNKKLQSGFYPSVRQIVMFCAIKSILFNESCLNFEHFRFKIGRRHNFVQSLQGTT